MTKHAGTSFPKPGEYIGIHLHTDSALYCRVMGTGDYRVINGNWDLDPEHPPAHAKDYRIVLRNMEEMLWQKACDLIEAAAVYHKDEMNPKLGAEEVFLALTNDSHSVEVLKEHTLRYNQSLTTYSTFERKVRLRARFYFRDEIKQEIPNYSLPKLAEMIFAHFISDDEISLEIQKQQINHHLNNAKMHFKKVTDNLKGLQPMTQLTIKNVTYINGTDVKEMSDSDIFAEIARAEQAIVALTQIKAKSSKLEKDIAAKQKTIDDLVKIVDAR